MDGMNQNNNNPYGRQDNIYQTNDPYSQNNAQQMNNPYQANDPYHHNPYQPQNTLGGQTVYPYNPQGKKKGAKIAIGLVCALVVLIGIGVGALAYYRSTPSYKITRGLMNLAKEIEQTKNPLSEKVGMSDIMVMMQEEGSHVETKLNLAVDVPFIGETTLGVDTDFYKDVHAKELSADTSLSLMNFDFAHLNIYANDEVFCFSMPELFMEDMYIENENVVSQFNNSILASGAPSDMEDFSIELFPDEDERISMRDWRSMSTVLDDFEADLNACRAGMTMEKVETGLYRVTFPAKETNRLIKSILESYRELYGAEEELDLLKEYKNLVASDVSLLLEIDGKNRIESIMLEEPLEVLDGEASLEMELLFLGETRSIDKTQGKIAVNGVDGQLREAFWQIQQTSNDNAYTMDMDFRWAEEEETLGKMKLVVECDAVKDEFNITYSLKDEETELEVVLESNIDDYDKGESIEIDLDKAAISMDGEELFKLSGEIGIEPMRGAVKSSVKPKTAFFEMTMSEWLEIIFMLEDEYGSLLDYLW